MIVSAFWKSPQRNRILLLAFSLVLVVGAAAYAQIWLNAWNRPFYDALARKDFGAFVQQLGVFAGLAGVLLTLNVAQLWLNQTSKVTLREGLVHDLLDEWLKPLRAFRLSNAGEIGANPDQRIHEDARHLTELSVDLGIGLLQATLLLLSFVGVLWSLSRSLAVEIGGHSFTLPPGYMVWSALFYAGAASFLSWWVGRPLIKLNAARYAREAELRFALVRINEGVGSIAAYGGEADERDRVETIFQTVLAASRRIVGAVTRLTWVTAGYGWFTIIAPILVAAPIYFNASANLSFGELMMIVGAFNQVQQSLRWFVDNFSVIADWRATLIRIASFRRTIVAIDTLGRTEEQIAFEEGGSFRFENLCIAAPECCRLDEAAVELKPGERVSVAGETSEQHTLLFRTLAGLWPWGSGRVVHPPRRTIMFMPSQAYMPPGTLRATITYPHPDHAHDTAKIAKAFEALGLERRLGSLDTIDRWDQLGNDERQRLAFVRVILQRPDWLVLDDVLDSLEDETRARVDALFRDELKDMGIVSLGDDKPGSLFTRTLHLVGNPAGCRFEPAASAKAATNAVRRPKRSAREAVPAQ